MRIGGLQKMTLLDYPGKVACTVFLTGCNLRCPYCHNPSLVLPGCAGQELPMEDLLDFLKTRINKLDGVCVTGGEPTIQEKLPEFLEQLHRLGFLVKLDTNGTNPKMLEALLDAGLLDYVAMDIKNSPGLYKKTCGGRTIFEAVEKSAGLLLKGAVDYEFRTTVCAPLHTPESLADIGRWLRGSRRYFLQPFENPGALVGSGVTALSEEELLRLREAVLPYISNTQIRGR